jgi:hypothetical protein
MRIFVLGDSFSDNLFETAYEYINHPEYINHSSVIIDYLKELQSKGIEKALWFTDHLTNWGYEVHNYGFAGCSNEHILYQFGKLPKFKEGDRIIINWTHPSRFTWIKENGDCIHIHRDIFKNKGEIINDIFNEQFLNRDYSFSTEGHLKNCFIPFIKYLINTHSKYKPIMWTPFNDLDSFLVGEKYHLLSNNNFNVLKILPMDIFIKEETEGRYNDGHYGRYGNYYFAVILDEIIKNDVDGDYMLHRYIFDEVVERIKKENVVFKF